MRGLQSKQLRLEAYRRAVSFRSNPRQVIREYGRSTEAVREELQVARDALPKVELSRHAERFGLDLIKQLGIDSLRAEITLFEAARAHAVADGRLLASPKDIRAVAPMAIRLRRSAFMKDFFRSQQREQKELARLLKDLTGGERSKKK